MANMNSIWQKLSKESEQKEACIKLQEQKIANLTKKSEKLSAQCSKKAQKVKT